jgi:hypothetical protein
VHEANHGALSMHILPTSATMVGVCMTVLSIMKLASPAGVITHKLLAVNSVVFLASAILSFVSMRPQRNLARLESLAEFTFLAGLIMLVLAAVIVSFEIV